MTRLFALFFALTACATATNDAEAPRPAMAHFRGPAAAAQLPHRTAQGAEASAVFDALRAALPPQDAYDVDALSCVFVSLPGHESTHCRVGAVSIEQEQARNLGEAVRNAGAQWDMGGKMPRVAVKNVHATRDTFAFDDEANAKRVHAPNVRLTGKRAEDVMAAIAGAGVREDDGTLLVVCHRFEAGKDPTCGYVLRGAPGPQLDRAQTLALWNAFVHDPKITVLNASDFVFDGQALSFTGVEDTVQPPPSPPSFP